VAIEERRTHGIEHGGNDADDQQYAVQQRCATRFRHKEVAKHKGGIDNSEYRRSTIVDESLTCVHNQCNASG
jgi:hypothetical protein